MFTITKTAHGLGFLLIIALLLTLGQRAWAADWRIQQYSGDKALTLDSSPAHNHTWWYSTQKIDPQKLYAELIARQGSGKSRAGHPFEQKGGWKPITVPANPVNQGFVEPGSSDMWYGKWVRMPEKLAAAPAVSLGWVSDRERFYVNGEFVAHTGDWDSPRPQPYDKKRIYEIPPHLVREGRANLLLVHVKGYFPHEMGLVKNTTEIAPAQDMWHDYYVRHFVRLLFLVLYLTTGSYFLFLFVRRRSEVANLFFGLFAYALVAYQFLRNPLKYEFGMEFYWLKKIEYMILFALVPLIYYFFRFYFPLIKKSLLRWTDRLMLIPTLWALAMISVVAFTSSAVTWDWINFNLVMPTWPIFIGVVIVLLVKKAWDKERDAYYFLGGMFIVTAAMVTDILQTSGYLNTPRLMGYAFIFFVMSLATILANRFVRLHHEVESLNKNLEQKVEERTEQLQQTLNQAQTLKVQQDGDYFLTTLLIKPLAVNYARSNRVDVDFLIRQKKRFEFKGREHEIGGDLCISHSLKLRGRDYTMFVNADAMGKSIQGAGGALVLGVVLKSIIARTEVMPEFYERYPEQWLKSSYLELQNVFVTFDGSMMISLVLGLVDDDNGLLYYINAEHPWSVLYRNGKADFIEQELSLRKVGMLGLDDSFRVHTFQMQTGDVILIGSDGRDDLDVSDESQEGRIMNEDENEFLRRVEDGDGELQGIFESLLKFGEPTDDLTLLRLHYRGQDAEQELDIPDSRVLESVKSGKKAFKKDNLKKAYQSLHEAYSKSPENFELLRDLAILALKQKDYQNASLYTERFVESYPAEEDFIYYTAYANKMQRNLRKAADFGERMRLRNPDHINNLINLADIYRLSQNWLRAEEFLAQVEEKASSEESALAKVRDLRDKIAKKKQSQISFDEHELK